MALADVLSRTGKLKDAERELRDALRFQPNDPAVLNNLGYFLVDHDKDLTEAFKMIERAVTAEPENPSYLDSLGWAYFKLGQLDQAEKYIVQSLKGRPRSAEVLDHLGDVRMKQGREEQARQSWRDALGAAPDRSQTERLRQKLAENKN
jgi:Flp pilus assembly protein TadD